MSQPPLVVVELTTDVNSTVEHLQELGEHIAYPNCCHRVIPGGEYIIYGHTAGHIYIAVTSNEPLHARGADFRDQMLGNPFTDCCYVLLNEIQGNRRKAEQFRYSPQMT